MNDALSEERVSVLASMEYGDVHVGSSLALDDKALPLRQKPACEHVLKSWDFTAKVKGSTANSRREPKARILTLYPESFEQISPDGVMSD